MKKTINGKKYDTETADNKQVYQYIIHDIHNNRHSSSFSENEKAYALQYYREQIIRYVLLQLKALTYDYYNNNEYFHLVDMPTSIDDLIQTIKNQVVFLSKINDISLTKQIKLPVKLPIFFEEDLKNHLKNPLRAILHRNELFPEHKCLCKPCYELILTFLAQEKRKEHSHLKRLDIYTFANYIVKNIG